MHVVERHRVVPAGDHARVRQPLRAADAALELELRRKHRLRQPARRRADGGGHGAPHGVGCDARGGAHEVELGDRLAHAQLVHRPPRRPRPDAAIGRAAEHQKRHALRRFIGQLGADN